MVQMPRVAETFKTVIDKQTHRTDSKLVNILHSGNVYQTYEDLTTSIDELETERISALCITIR
jgi:hypothetical protein